MTAWFVQDHSVTRTGFCKVSFSLLASTFLSLEKGRQWLPRTKEPNSNSGSFYPFHLPLSPQTPKIPTKWHTCEKGERGGGVGAVHTPRASRTLEEKRLYLPPASVARTMGCKGSLTDRLRLAREDHGIQRVHIGVGVWGCSVVSGHSIWQLDGEKAFCSFSCSQGSSLVFLTQSFYWPLKYKWLFKC